jgi:WD40 repeat protein
MFVNLVTVARLTLIALFLLTGCSRINHESEATSSLPTETSDWIDSPMTAGLETSTPSASPPPISTPTPQPLVSPTVMPTVTPTAVVLNPNNLDKIIPGIFLDHQNSSVTAIDFSPNNDFLASSSEDGLVRVWEIPDRSLRFTLTEHTDVVFSLAFSPDGNLLASASADRTVRLWKVEDGSLVRTIDTSLVGKPLKVEFSNDGSLIAIAGDLCYIMLRNTNTGILRRTFQQPKCQAQIGGPVVSWGLIFTPDNLSLVSGDGQPGGSGGSIQVWNYEKYASPQLVRGYDLVVRDISLSPDGTTLAVALSGSPEIWLMKIQDGALIHILKGHTYRVNNIRYSADGTLLASAGRDATVRLWDSATGELLSTLEGHSSAVNCIAFSPDGSTIASGSDDGNVIMWELAQP